MMPEGECRWSEDPQLVSGQKMVEPKSLSKAFAPVIH